MAVARWNGPAARWIGKRTHDPFDFSKKALGRNARDGTVLAMLFKVAPRKSENESQCLRKPMATLITRALPHAQIEARDQIALPRLPRSREGASVGSSFFPAESKSFTEFQAFRVNHSFYVVLTCSTMAIREF